MNKRLTVGYRVRLKEKCLNQRGIKGQDMILVERDCGDFVALILVKGTKNLIDKDVKLVHGSMAWFSEKDLELVDTEVNTNLTFSDWYDEIQDEICPDCGHYPPKVLTNSGTLKCNECGCSF